MKSRDLKKHCCTIYFVAGLIIISITFYVIQNQYYSHTVNGNGPTVKSDSSITSLAESYVPAKNYERLNQLASGNAERIVITEKVEITRYNIMADVPKEMNSADCVFMKQASYHICIHDDTVDGISGVLRKNIQHEPNTQILLKEFFKRDPNAMFIDIGCMIGVHTLYVAKLSQNMQVLSVDPYPQNVMRLHKSAHLNNVQDRITVNISLFRCLFP